jgi:hypothetical protein
LIADSPEAKAAQADGWAEKKAIRKPMVSVTREFGGFRAVKDMAATLGKRVIRNLEKERTPDDEVQAARKRMMSWLKVLEKYHQSIREVRGDKSMPKYGKEMLLADMCAAEDEARVELFGE